MIFLIGIVLALVILVVGCSVVFLRDRTRSQEQHPGQEQEKSRIIFTRKL